MDANGAVNLDVQSVEHFPSDASRIRFEAGQGEIFFRSLVEQCAAISPLSINYFVVFRHDHLSLGFNINFDGEFRGDFLTTDFEKLLKQFSCSDSSASKISETIDVLNAIQRNLVVLTACILANTHGLAEVGTQQLMPDDRLTGLVFSSGLYTTSALDMHVDLEREVPGRQSRIVFSNIPPVVRNAPPDASEVRAWNRPDDVVEDRAVSTQPYDVLLFDRATTEHSAPGVSREGPVIRRESLRLTYNRA